MRIIAKHICQNHYRFAGKKMMNSQSVADHPPTTDLWETGDGIINKNVKIAGWNVNGFRSVYEKGALKQFIDCVLPDIFCLNETKINYKSYQKQLKLLTIQGYYQYWNFCKISSGYSGVAIFSKYKPIKVIQDFPQDPNHSLEGRLLTLQYNSFYLVNVYKPNAGRKLQRLYYRTKEYDTVFISYIQDLMKSKPVVIFGDMNVAHQQIDLENPKGNKGKAAFTIEERSAFSRLLETRLIDTWRYTYPSRRGGYTFWPYFADSRFYNRGWRLDYILTDRRINFTQPVIHNKILGSDHCPVSVNIIQ